MLSLKVYGCKEEKEISTMIQDKPDGVIMPQRYTFLQLWISVGGGHRVRRGYHVAIISTVKCDGVYHVSFISRHMC